MGPLVPFRRSLPITLLLALPLLACGADTAEQADPAVAEGAIEAAPVDRALFDSITWPTAAAPLNRGATVYSYSCAKCHGDSGAGNAGYVLRGRVLRPPSFLADDWRFANDPAGLRQAILKGNDRGMPHWGNAGLQPRDIDAVAHYITLRLWGAGGR